ncbi:MAG TPA: hypothetical protein VLT58_03450 [Polyangia bacterium]|nr:hypothetical protein [Polyangia bacterium]
MSTLLRLAASVAAIAAVGLADAARGQTPGGSGAGASAPVMAAEGVCPSQAAVWTELGTLVPRDRFAARLVEVKSAGPAIELADLGASYRVTAAGRVRVYRDDAHDCADRARVAALFIALAIDPADTVAAAAPRPPAPPPTPPPPTPPPVIQPEPRAPPLVDVQVAPAFDVGLGSGSVTFTPAGLVDVAVGRGLLAALVSIAADLPADASAGSVRVRQWRAPVTVGVRARLGRERVEPYAELGVAAGPIVARGRDVVSPSTAVSLELGVAAALGVRIGGRTGGFLVARGELVPDPPDVFALPAGTAGHTARFWIGAAAGLSLESR